MPPPSWLPQMVELDAANWLETLKKLHAIFCADFQVGRTPTFEGVPVRWDTRQIDPEKYHGFFWHIITREYPQVGEEREIEFQRAKRLPWCSPTILNCKDAAAVLTFLYEEGNGRPRVYIWLKDLDYIVVMDPRSTGGKPWHFLLTAFPLDGPRRRKQILKKYENRLA